MDHRSLHEEQDLIKVLVND